MRHVVMTENADHRPRSLDAGDHGRMVLGVRKTVPGLFRTIRQAVQDGGQRRLVGYVAGGEQQPRLLAVQGREFRFEVIMHRAGAADVARAAGAGTHRSGGLARRVHQHRMVAHGDVVVRRPNQDPRAVAPHVVWEAIGPLLQRRENPVPSLSPDGVEGAAAMVYERVHPAAVLGEPSR